MATTKNSLVFTCIAVIFGIGFAISGCSDMQRHELMMKDMQANISDLKRSQSENSIRADELDNKIFLLHERLNSINKDIDELKAMAIPTKPPDELKVVKLSPEDAVKKEEPQIKEQIKEEHKNKEVRLLDTAKRDEGIPESEILYHEAQELYTAGKFEEAILGFKKFLKHFPKDTPADNAQYWIGEAYYSNKDFAKAVVEFKKVVDNYPDENKAPDALLKIGFSFMEMGDKNKSVESFKDLLARYPKSSAAEKARQRLKEN